MADPDNRFFRNAPGAWYVDDSCTDCDLCRETAPAIFRRDDGHAHSFVLRQPQTAEELALAMEALEGCPTESIGNDGG